MRTAAFSLSTALAIAMVAPAAHAAADRPQFPPARDVSATYRVTGSDADAIGPVTLDYSAALDKLRADVGGRYEAIIDLHGKTMSLVLAEQHIAMRVPVGRDIDRLIAMPATAAVQRLGTARVAGLACTEWHVTAKDSSGTVCITEDGVPLRGQGTDAKNRSGGFEATSVTYAPQPAALFGLPPGVKEMDLSALAGMQNRPKP